MNETNIEKLNLALMQLIEAYEELQGKNEDLENTITNLNAKVENLQEEKVNLENTNNDLEAKVKDLDYKLNDFNSNTEQQETKMDGMLSKIQSLLGPKDKIIKPSSIEESSKPDTNSSESNINMSDDEELDVLDLKLDDIKDTSSAKNTENTSSSEYDKTKLDLGRMESLLNGLNK